MKSILDDRVKQDDILSSKNIDIHIFKSGEILIKLQTKQQDKIDALHRHGSML